MLLPTILLLPLSAPICSCTSIIEINDFIFTCNLWSKDEYYKYVLTLCLSFTWLHVILHAFLKQTTRPLWLAESETKVSGPGSQLRHQTGVFLLKNRAFSTDHLHWRFSMASKYFEIRLKNYVLRHNCGTE